MEEWKEYRLGDLCTISSSKRIFAKEYVNEGIPFYKGGQKFLHPCVIVLFLFLYRMECLH